MVLRWILDSILEEDVEIILQACVRDGLDLQVLAEPLYRKTDTDCQNVFIPWVCRFPACPPQSLNPGGIAAMASPSYA